jgi:hypothetical protein
MGFHTFRLRPRHASPGLKRLESQGIIHNGTLLAHINRRMGTMTFDKMFAQVQHKFRSYWGRVCCAEKRISEFKNTGFDKI